MSPPDDIQLLREYALEKSEAAFAELVARHVNLVYSAALRKTGNAHAAEEVTQAVFLILSRKAAGLPAGMILSGWLYQTARLTAANYVRTEMRRARREQEALMQSSSHPSESDVWAQIAPLLEDAIGRLGDKDRNAVVLRFFNGRSLAEVGAAMGVSEDAAKMRVNRAVEKLRAFFQRRGVVTSTTLIAGAVSANSVQAAPEGLAVAAGKTAVTASTQILAEGTLKSMSWLKLKTAAAVGFALFFVGSAGSLIVAGTRGWGTRSESDASSNRPMLIVPGVSMGKVRAGMTIQQVIAELGAPDRRTGRRLHYTRQGFTVLPRAESDVVLAVFCGDTLGINGSMARAFKGRTKEGVGIGSTRAEIVAAFGPPTQTRSARPNQEEMIYAPLHLSLSLCDGKVVYVGVDL